MIDVAILCPLSIEYNAVRKYLAPLTSKVEKQFGLSYEAGKIYAEGREWHIALFETEGKVGNLQARTTKILHSLKPKFTFLVGIAAGIKDVQIGDIVIGTKAYGYESGKETDDGFLARPDVIYSSRKLIELSKQIVREKPPENYKVAFGAIAGGNRVINTAKNSLQIIQQSYNDTIALEMESIGFAIAAQEAQVPFLNIRSISDLAANKNDNFQKIAAERAADFVVQLIKRLPKIEESTPVQKLTVYCVQQPFKVLEWRKLKPVELYISKKGLQFHLNGNDINVAEIKAYEHIKMKGDFSKNWIYVQLMNEEIFYFSEKTFLSGIGSIFGGSKKLLKKLEPLVLNT